MERFVLLVVGDRQDAHRGRPTVVDEAVGRFRDRLLVERHTSLDIVHTRGALESPAADDLMEDLRRLDQDATLCLVVVGPGYGEPYGPLSPELRETFPELVPYEGASRNELVARFALKSVRRSRVLFVLLRDIGPDGLPVVQPAALDRLTFDVKQSGAYTMEMPDDTDPAAEARAAFADQLLDALLRVAIGLQGGQRGSVNQAAHTEAAPRPMHVDENVQFTVYRPKAVRPNEWYELLAFAHLADRRPDAPADQLDPLEQVRRQARALLGSRADSYSDPRSDSTQAIPQAGELTFLPQVPGVTFNPERATFRWLEDVHRQEFKLRADTFMAGQTARGRLSVYLGAIIVAEVGLAFGVDWNARPATEPFPPLAPEPARPYRKIFASYSHEDTLVVEQFEQLARSLGDEYLRDVISLHSGSPWDDGLLRLIDQADVFQLFWSSHSMRSPFVQREWQYALQLGRPNFIRPTYWEDPLPRTRDPELPPSTLEALHFHQLKRLVPAQPPAPSPTAAAQQPTPQHNLSHHFTYTDGNSPPMAAAQRSASPGPDRPPEPVAAAPLKKSFGQSPATKGKARPRLVLLGAATVVAGVASASLILSPLRSNSSRAPASSQPPTMATLAPTTGARNTTGLESMSVRGAAVISGSPSPKPGGPTTVYGVDSGDRVSVILTFSARNTARHVLAGAALRCLGRTGQWVVVGPYEDSLDIPAKRKDNPDSVTRWHSPWMLVPKQCRKGTESPASDGFINGWSQSEAGTQPVGVVAHIKLLS